MKNYRTQIAAIVACTVIALLLGALALRARQPPPEYEYEIVSNTFGVFLLEKNRGDTWKWFIEHDDDDEEIVEMGWQHHQKPVRLNSATMENYQRLLPPSP